jgi:hypothetical protein
MSALVGLGRRTVTGMLMTSGQAFEDWSAAYRVFTGERFAPDTLFGVVRSGILAELAPGAPYVVHVDDTLAHKTGTKIHGVAYKRDPLGPAFQTNLIRAQRFLQMSASLPYGPNPSEASVIPIDFAHAPTPPKPRKNAPAEQWKAYKEKRKQTALPLVAAQRTQHLRAWLDAQPNGRERPFWEVGDGGYTNTTTLKNLPERTTFIARVRKDAELYYLPDPGDDCGKGRKRIYGRRAPTPEAIRQDDAVPWQQVTVWAAGKTHACRVKVAGPFRSRMAGERPTLRLVIIAPLGYRPRKGSRILYREPAYLLCTDPQLSVQDIVQAYAWRWGIEVNHRDEKQLIGVGQAQVRTPKATGNVPALLAATYAMMLLAARQAYGHAPIPDALPRPKWQQDKGRTHASTPEMIQHLRAELWGRALGVTHFSRFADRPTQDANAEKCRPRLDDAVLYAAP